MENINGPSPQSTRKLHHGSSFGAFQQRQKKLREERSIKYANWLEHGSDNLADAWVSVSPYAESHAVTHHPLTEIVEMICDGGPIIVPGKWRPREVSLDENQEHVRRLYELGCREAVVLNRPRIKTLLEKMGLRIGPETVEVQTEQPKGNEKLFYISALVVDGVSHPVRDRVVYHIPQVFGKMRANDAKKSTPGVTLAGLCLGQRNKAFMHRWTGLYPLDLDGIANLTEIKALVIKDSHVRLVFTSITGSGLRVCAAGPIARSPEEYERFYKLIAEKLCRVWGMESKSDETTYDPARLTFLPYDPEIFFQP
jgi:hypothetical protein